MRGVVALVGLASVLALAGCARSLGVAESTDTLNAFRVSNGLGPLSTDAHLASMAQGHAADMARRNALDHDGFMETRGPAGARAENVSYGCADTACAIKQWANSSGHRHNMLLGDIHKYGLAYAVSNSGRRYWALEVGE
jgi:uncharacterized protein YkwD